MIGSIILLIQSIITHNINEFSLTFKDSAQDANKNCFSGSGLIGSIFFLNNRMTASIIRVIRYGGFPNLRTVAMSAALIV